MGIATGAALGGFVGAGVAFLTGREEKMDLYTGRGIVAGGYVGACYEIVKALTGALGSTRAVD